MKTFVDTVGIKITNLKDKLHSKVLQLSELSPCKERPQNAQFTFSTKLIKPYRPKKKFTLGG